MDVKRISNGLFVFVTFLTVATSQNSSTMTSGPLTSEPPKLYTATPVVANAANDCKVVLANNVSDGVQRNAFKGMSGKRAVYISFKVLNSTGPAYPFPLKGNDTFAPDQWVWASSKGKNLLRMPLDYIILSLGILSLGTVNQDILLDPSTENCLASAEYSDVVHVLAKYLANVTGNGTTIEIDSPDPVICRSAYAFTHAIFVNKGIGYKCCSSPATDQDKYVCDTPYTISWEMVWYGPVVLLCWVYAIFLLHFYKLYRRSFNLKKIRELSGLRKTLNEIKADVTNRIVRMSEDLARLRGPESLISLRETAGFLDVLGVEKAKQSKITAAFRIVFILLLLFIYYLACGLYLWQYRIQLEYTFKSLKDSGAIYLNILGHLGWVWCSMDNGIAQYAVFEVIWTLLMPLFAAMVYLSLNFRQEAVEFAEKQKKQHEPLRNGGDIRDVLHIQKIFMPAVTGCKRLFLRFMVSSCGKVVQGISFAMFILFVVFIAGVFIVYLVYFVGLGVFANIDVISPYIIPLIVCLTFFTSSFNPAYFQYRMTKDTIFSLCLACESRLLIKKHKEIFLPRDLVDDFYIPNSRSTIYNCVLRILVVIAFMLLVLLVILTIQYPYYFQMESIVSFLGVQVVFFLPILSSLVNGNNQFSDLEKTVLERDLKTYIEQYEKDHPPTEEPVRVVEVIATPGSDSAIDNDEDVDEDADDRYELGEIGLGFGNPVTDPVVRGAADLNRHLSTRR